MLKAPFPYFGGKSGAVNEVWRAFGEVKNYVEPFCGSAAMLLGAPDGRRIETINDRDSMVANFWRAVAAEPEEVALHADWPVIETDLFARHSWLVRQREDLTERLNADPAAYDAKIAGWWAWGVCAWIGSGWCSGDGPWVHDGERLIDRRQMPHLGDAGQGINRQMPHLGNAGRGDFIAQWLRTLQARLCRVRVCSGDWLRVVQDSVTTRHGLTAVFLDPPYENGEMDYGAGGMGMGIAKDVQRWCAENGNNPLLRVVLCGHAGEHDELLQHGWHTRAWRARKGYALTDEAKANTASETLWCSPNCVPMVELQSGLF